MMGTGNAFAYDAKVIIVNGISNHCLPYPSCYKPFQVNISSGDTITWINGDNRTHTATTVTPNYGPQGFFDSGSILPSHSFTQFFAISGKYPYYDKMDWWPSGIIVVSKGVPLHSELAWVNGSLTLANQQNSSQKVVITKEIQNTGGSDANSIILRLNIRNDSSFIFYDNIIRADVPAKKNTPISFVWNDPRSGNYILSFDADASHVAGETNENTEQSSDLISITGGSENQLHYVILDNMTLTNGNANAPEFSSVSNLVLAISILSIMVICTRSYLKIRI